MSHIYWFIFQNLALPFFSLCITYCVVLVFGLKATSKEPWTQKHCTDTLTTERNLAVPLSL